jgi:hypothetical protein
MKHALIIAMVMSGSFTVSAMDKKIVSSGSNRKHSSVVSRTNSSESSSVSFLRVANLLGSVSSVVEGVNFVVFAENPVNPAVLGIGALYGAEAVNHTISALEVRSRSVLVPLALAGLNGGNAFLRFFLGTVEDPVTDAVDMIHASVQAANALYFLGLAVYNGCKDVDNVVPEPSNSKEN